MFVNRCDVDIRLSRICARKERIAHHLRVIISHAVLSADIERDAAVARFKKTLLVARCWIVVEAVEGYEVVVVGRRGHHTVSIRRSDALHDRGEVRVHDTRCRPTSTLDAKEGEVLLVRLRVFTAIQDAFVVDIVGRTVRLLRFRGSCISRNAAHAALDIHAEKEVAHQLEERDLAQVDHRRRATVLVGLDDDIGFSVHGDRDLRKIVVAAGRKELRAGTADFVRTIWTRDGDSLILSVESKCVVLKRITGDVSVFCRSFLDRSVFLTLVANEKRMEMIFRVCLNIAEPLAD